MIEEFLTNCNACAKCQKVCQFLGTHGKPDEILKKDDDTVFECTNCRACTIVCPFKLSPSDAIYTKKTTLLQSGNVSERVKNALNSSRAFAYRGHKFPFSHYTKCETAFWPGCGLAGVSPEIVKSSVKSLSKRLDKPVGLILDCCFDPCYQIGDVMTVKDACSEIQKRLEACGVKEVITGCGNCTKILSMYLQGIKVRHILEVLQKDDLSDLPQDITLHNPCPSFRFEGLQGKTKDIISAKSNMANSNTLPNCCGLGGGLHHLNTDLSDAFAKKAISVNPHTDNVIEDNKKASDTKNTNTPQTILTYCMGCKSKFINQGQKAYHVLETLPGVKRLEDVPSSLKKYINRISLSASSKINLKKVSLLIVLVTVIILTTKFRAEGYISVDSIIKFIESNRVLAPALFIAFYAIAPTVFIPSLALTLGAGFIWGPIWGSLFAITGATIGATVPFLLSRYIMGDWVKRRFSEERWHALNTKVNTHGWKAVAFTRIVPIFPYPVLNYLFGITPIPLIHYVLATFLFMLPACVAYTAFGSSMGELILKGNIKGLVLGIVIASIAMLIPFALKKMVKKVGDEK